MLTKIHLKQPADAVVKQLMHINNDICKRKFWNLFWLCCKSLLSFYADSVVGELQDLSG